jgi:hypothetical protein
MEGAFRIREWLGEPHLSSVTRAGQPVRVEWRCCRVAPHLIREPSSEGE